MLQLHNACLHRCLRMPICCTWCPSPLATHPDEFDKMTSEHQALLGAMEQQEVSRRVA